MSSSAAQSLAAEPAALPSDAILVHIGMRKTGTTAIQSLLADAREDLRPLGVHYPGNSASHHAAARSLLGRPDFRLARDKRTVPTLKVWEELADEAREWGSRVVISSEFLSYAKPEHVRRLVEDIGRDRLHILVGIRNLAPVALSSWQQDLKTGGYVWGLDKWLTDNFRRGDDADRQKDGSGSTFWELSDPAEIVLRWADVVGPEHLSVIVMSEGDRAQLPRTFERMLDIPEGSLSERQVAFANRSMTELEAELVRRVNAAVRPQLDWPEYTSLIRYGMVNHLIETRSPAAGEKKASLPDWASAQAVEEGRRAAERIAAAGVHVIGNLEDMGKELNRGTGDAAAAPAEEVPIDAAVEAVLGVATRAARESRAIKGKRRKPKVPAAPKPRTPTVDEVGTRALAAALAARARASARRRVSLLAKRVKKRAANKHR